MTSSNQQECEDGAGSRADSPRPSGLFPDTRWSLVIAARSACDKIAQEALAHLCQIYWFPLYVFVRGRGFSPHDAEDITQSFFARFLAREDFNCADSDKGRLRAFLLVSMKHFIASWVRRARRQKRGGEASTVSIDRALAEERYGKVPRDNASPDLIFEKQWAVALLQQVMQSLEEEYAEKGKGEIFEALRGHISLWAREKPYAEAAAELGMSEGSLKTAAHRMRQRYRDLQRREVAHTVAENNQVDAEINHFFQLFS